MGCSIDYGRVTGTSFFPMEILQGADSCIFCLSTITSCAAFTSTE